MYRRMLVAIPGLQMTIKQFETLDKKYFELMPEYKVWYDETVDEVKRTRTLHNAFGRIRVFMGEVDNIVREGLNFPIQSTAADILSYGLLEFFEEYKKLKLAGVKMRLVGSVHDSVVLLLPDGEMLSAIRLMRKTLCASRKINETQVEFLGDITIGQSYAGGEEKPIDEWIKSLSE